jgi:putative adenylate-forming enzyme
MNFKIAILYHYFLVRFNRMRFHFDKTKWHKYYWKSFVKTLNQSPYYQKIAPQYLEDLMSMQKIQKQEFMENFDRINTAYISKEEAFSVALLAEKSRNFNPEINKITIGLSSGTSGNRGIFMANQNERALWVATILDRVIGFSFKKRNVAFFLRANSNLYESTKSKFLNFQFFDLLISFKNQVDRLNDLNPHILIGQPSLLIELAKFQISGELKIKPEKIISVAEVLEANDKVFLEQTFNQIIHQVYQCTEGLLASTCKNGTLHFHEDYLQIDKNYIDKERFYPIITDFVRKTQPIVRYELNDIIIEKKNCGCENKFLAIEKIEGRSDDILNFINDQNEPVSIYPDFFRRAIILSDETINDYILVQKSAKILEIYLGNKEIQLQEKVKKHLNELLRSYQISSVEFVFTNERNVVPGEKLRRIKNGIKAN